MAPRPLADGDALPPLVDRTRDKKQDGSTRYHRDVVEDYRDDPEAAAEKHEHPTRHYNQSISNWGDGDTVATLLERLDVVPEESIITVFGGFTGEFTDALHSAGCRVVFTDPMDEWVAEAEERGFEAYTATAEEITGDIIRDSTAFATFECYHPLIEPGEKLYTVLRFLTAADGLLFAVSEGTSDDLQADGKVQTILSSLGPYVEEYNVERRYREIDGLRIYQFYAPTEAIRESLVLDGHVLAALHARLKGGDVAMRHVRDIADELEVDTEQITESLERLSTVFMGLVPDSMRHYVQYSLEVYSLKYTYQF